MQILALVTDAFGRSGGIARYNQDLMTALAQSNSVSGVAILPRFGQEEGPLPTAITQYGPSAGTFAWSRRAFLLAARRRVDLIFCGHLNAVALAAVIAKVTRAALWVQVHGIEAWQARSTAIRAGLEAAVLVTSVSRYTRNRLLEWSDIAPERVRVLPNTFAAEFSPNARNDALAMHHRLGGKRVILTVGRLNKSERYKGHDRIIRALPKVLERVPDAAYLVVGSGDDESRLRQLAKAEGLADCVTFAGQVPVDELPSYFGLADVFAMPSTGEGFGIVFLEAAACGLPVVGGNLDGSVDALADGAIGRLVNPNCEDQIVGALVASLQVGRTVPAAERIKRFGFCNFARHVDQLVQTFAN